MKSLEGEEELRAQTPLLTPMAKPVAISHSLSTIPHTPTRPSPLFNTSTTPSSPFPVGPLIINNPIRLSPHSPPLLPRAKFDKFGPSDEIPVPVNPPPLPQLPEDEDSDLPSDLEDAVRQSSHAAAAFISSGGMRAIVELLIPQFLFLDGEGAQAEMWGYSRIFVDSLIEELGNLKIKAIFPDAGAAALLNFQWNDATFGFSSLSDRRPVNKEDDIVVMILPDYQMLEYVEKIASSLSDDPPRPLIMWNPRLVSEDVGVGFNVRKLRRYFLSTFTTVYSMRPLLSGAVFRCYPGMWKVFYDDTERPNRYRLAKEQPSRPDATELELILGGSSEKSEEGSSFLDMVGSAFSSLNRFMRVISR